VLEAIALKAPDLHPADGDGTWTPHGSAVAVYTYQDENGLTLFEVCRTARKQFPQRRPDSASRTGWRWKLDGVHRVIYRLPAVIEAVARGEQVYVVEGEKDVHAVERAGGVATCNPGGAGKWRSDFNEPLRNANVIVVADADEVGQEHAKHVALNLRPVAASVRIVKPASGKDAADHLAAGYTLDDFLPAGDQASRESTELTDLTVDQILAANPPESKDDLLAANPLLRELLGGKETAATEIARLVSDSGALLFHDAENTPYASFTENGVRETWPLRSRRARLLARHLFHRAKQVAPSSQAVGDAIATLEAEALFDGPELEVHVRLAGDKKTIHADLGDPSWRALTINAAGWTVLNKHPVPFIRSRGLAALPEPAAEGSLGELRSFLNIDSDADWVLLVAWLLAAWRAPGQPYPALVLHGEQGTAKSTTARVVRDLVDPSTVPLRSPARDVHDLMISATASWVVAFDNVSRLQPWLSDALCRLATGGGFATRELYTDTEEVLFQAQRPVILNGIEELATRSDLLDRSILITLPTIPSTARRSEEQFWREFDRARPTILAGLLNALSGALARMASVEVVAPPRMADLAQWVVAAEPTLGWRDGTFLRAYEQNRAQANEVAIDASPIGSALVEVASVGFEGTATELLRHLTDHADEKMTKTPEWPKNGRALSGQLRRIAPNLRSTGIEISNWREPASSRRRLWRVGKGGHESA
jgi:hypothetical protein